MKEAKFTATMVFNADKEVVQELRNEFDLSEKEMMSFLLQVALKHKDELSELVQAEKDAQAITAAEEAQHKEAEKERVKKERAEARAAKKADKEEAQIVARKAKRGKAKKAA